jgi:hypothetical protein
MSSRTSERPAAINHIVSALEIALVPKNSKPKLIGRVVHNGLKLEASKEEIVRHGLKLVLLKESRRHSREPSPAALHVSFVKRFTWNCSIERKMLDIYSKVLTVSLAS